MYLVFWQGKVVKKKKKEKEKKQQKEVHMDIRNYTAMLCVDNRIYIEYMNILCFVSSVTAVCDCYRMLNTHLEKEM